MSDIPVECPGCLSEDTFPHCDGVPDSDGISTSVEYYCNECAEEFVAVYTFQQSFIKE